MGTIIDTLFNTLMGWMRGLVNNIWALFTTDKANVLEIFGRYWLPIVGIIIAVGLVVDWLIWLIRWQPYHLWAIALRRMLHIEEPEEEEADEKPEAAAPRTETAEEEEPADETQWMPENALYLGEEEKRRAMEQAERVPDAEIGAYPGMRYDAKTAQTAQGTQRYSAVRQEGPGAAEVARRREEIDAWRRQQEEEARAGAAAQLAAQQAETGRRQQEQAAQAEAAAQQEEARRQQEEYQQKLAEYERQKAAYEAEQARLAQEEYRQKLAEYERQKAAYERQKAAYEAEQARLAQEEYQQKLAEYERQKAQYERELAEYQRQQARQQAAGRRSAPEDYSSYVQGEPVNELPDAPRWPTAQDPRSDAAKKPQRKEGPGRLARLAQLMETEEEDVTGIVSLPPRVDQREAYKTTQKPVKRKR